MADKGRKRCRRGVVGAMALVALAGCLLGCGSRGAAAPSPGPVTPATPSPSPVATAASSPVPVAPAMSAEPAADVVAGLPESKPLSVRIPKINAESSLIPLGLDPDGQLAVPPVSKPMQAGWYIEGPTPGEVGPAVIVGHVDGMRKPGIFYRLRELAPGDVVLVARADGTTAKFVVSEKQQVAKSRFPTERVYGDTPGPELRLITCGGAFDRPTHNYLDNIIVYAKLAP